MGDTDSRQPGHVVALPNRGKAILLGGAVLGGDSMGICAEGLDGVIGRMTILSGVAH